METSEIITHILQLIAGVGTFLVACEIMSDNLQSISSSSLKELFAKVSDKKIICVFIGALATAAIQSSGATTVMVIGFVNAGIIDLHQAACIIFGSEIGTTLTGQIVALGMMSEGNISTTTIFSAFIGIGIFIQMLSKKDSNKKIGGIMIGFGMIFVGLSMMSSSMDSFAKLPVLKDFLANINSPIMLIVVGAILTAVIQSSSAMTTIAITMIVAGLINLEQGIYITLGANVGTCVTGALAALTSGTNAKRTSTIQLIFNIGGVVILAIIDAIIKMLTKNEHSVSMLFVNAFPNMPQTQLAMFHTVFNVASVIVALPISELIVNLASKFVSGDKNNADPHLHYFDFNMMSSPILAVQQIKMEIINMSKIAIRNFNISINTIKTLDFKDVDEFVKNEDELDYLNEHLVEIVSELSKKTINAKDYAYLSSTYRAISDLERIGDYSENIVEYAQHLDSKKEKFSEEALQEIEGIKDLINNLYDLTLEIYEKYDEEKFKQANDIEEHIDDYTEMMANNHIKRMNKGKCNADTGSQYLQLSSDVERIADHLININDKDLIISH